MTEVNPIKLQEPESETTDSSSALLWIKISFIVVAFAESFLSGMLPTWSESCRSSPKILGIANSFAGGVFLAIAFMHITPEEIEAWNELEVKKGVTKVFPLPELLIFVGYTFILLIDKVLFDTHALFDHDHDAEHGHDPAEAKLESNLKASMSRANALAQNGDPRASRIEQKEGVDDAMKSYLNPHDRFATRMKASVGGGRGDVDAEAEAQQNLFVDGANVDINKAGK